MKKLLISVAWFGMSAAAPTVALASTSFGSDALAPPGGSPVVIVDNTTPDPDLTFTLDPSVEGYPPSADTTTCDTTGAAPCVYFSGTLTDNDTDGSLLDLESIAIIYTDPTDANYFALDNTFYDFYETPPFGPPGLLEGDTDDYVAPNTWTGLIFGVDIISPPPVGVYVETAEITACNLTNDGNCESGNPDPGAFTEDAAFTIVVTPEPTSGLLILAGLLLLVALDRARRLRMAPRVSRRSST